MDRPPCPSDSHDRQAVLERLGSSLREARLEQGFSLSDLAAKLRMGEEQLRALEDGNQAQLPEPVFVIAQSRRVAAALGIDVTPLLAPLKQASTLAPHPAALAQQPPGQRQAAGPLRLPAPLLAAAALLAAAGGGLLWGWPQLRQLGSAIHGPATTASPAATPPKPKPSASANELRLSSREPSWLEVQTSTGAVLFQGTFRGERRFPLNQGLRVKAGRPDLVQASLGDQPPRALGPIEQIRWVSFQAGRAPAPAP
ncbi:MAG: helix-turn-helix domain-containing protein [Vulcanococcus sp.]